MILDMLSNVDEHGSSEVRVYEYNAYLLNYKVQVRYFRCYQVSSTSLSWLSCFFFFFTIINVHIYLFCKLQVSLFCMHLNIYFWYLYWLLEVYLWKYCGFGMYQITDCILAFVYACCFSAFRSQRNSQKFSLLLLEQLTAKLSSQNYF